MLIMPSFTRRQIDNSELGAVTTAASHRYWGIQCGGVTSVWQCWVWSAPGSQVTPVWQLAVSPHISSRSPALLTGYLKALRPWGPPSVTRHNEWFLFSAELHVCTPLQPRLLYHHLGTMSGESCSLSAHFILLPGTNWHYSTYFYWSLAYCDKTSQDHTRMTSECAYGIKNTPWVMHSVVVWGWGWWRTARARVVRGCCGP